MVIYLDILFSLKVFGCKEEIDISQMIQDKPDGTIMPQRSVLICRNIFMTFNL